MGCIRSVRVCVCDHGFSGCQLVLAFAPRHGVERAGGASRQVCVLHRAVLPYRYLYTGYASRFMSLHFASPSCILIMCSMELALRVLRLLWYDMERLWAFCALRLSCNSSSGQHPLLLQLQGAGMDGRSKLRPRVSGVLRALVLLLMLMPLNASLQWCRALQWEAPAWCRALQGLTRTRWSFCSGFSVGCG